MKKLMYLILAISPMLLFGQKLAVIRAVHDGDSYGVRFLARPDTTIFLRLHNVDAPEIIFYVTKEQPYGRQAGDSMRVFLKGDTVSVIEVYKDKYGRMVCDIKKDSVDVTEYVITKGYGWYVDDPAVSIEREVKLRELQEYAKKKKVGLWGERGRKIKPSTWRKKYTRLD